MKPGAAARGHPSLKKVTARWNQPRTAAPRDQRLPHSMGRLPRRPTPWRDPRLGPGTGIRARVGHPDIVVRGCRRPHHHPALPAGQYRHMVRNRRPGRRPGSRLAGTGRQFWNAGRLAPLARRRDRWPNGHPPRGPFRWCGAGAGIRAGHSDVVTRLSLVSPHFLRARAALPQRFVPLIRVHLRRVSAARLAGMLTGNRHRTGQLESSAAGVPRPPRASCTGRARRPTAWTWLGCSPTTQATCTSMQWRGSSTSASSVNRRRPLLADACGQD
jgi:hypothetical protein